MAMEDKKTVTFTYEMVDNGFVLNDETNCVKQVFEDEDLSEEGDYHYDRERHEKKIGMWVYEEIDEFMQNTDTCECEITLTIRRTQRGLKELYESNKEKEEE